MDINHYLERAALADQTDLSEEQLYQPASDFGLGMGNMEAT